MGKKDKNKKKGKGAEKTAIKTDKKLVAKQMKLLKKIGEVSGKIYNSINNWTVTYLSMSQDNIENIISKFESDKSGETTEAIITQLSARANFTLCSHPDKEEIIMFGGEFFNGQKTEIYDDFVFYNIPKNEWKAVKCTSGPPPRSGAQMVSVSTDGGQLWMFGGEFASPSQSQFYHYKDLWVYRITGKKWEKVTAANGPSARSGHRMVVSKKKLFVFGGFHDNNVSYKYFNDLYAFSLEDYTWSKIEVTGGVPPARSGCCMVPTSEGKILIWGGYSKSSVKKEVDRGVTHSDMYSLAQDEKNNFKWTLLKPGGQRPPPRSGMSTTVAANGKIYTFGGVMDTVEDDEDVQGQFSNELHMLQSSNNTWKLCNIASKKGESKSTKGLDMKVDKEAGEKKEVVSNDGVFTMTVGGSSSSSAAADVMDTVDSKVLVGPTPRMNPGLVVCKGNLYVVGGLFEQQERQYTLTDLYAVDLHRMDKWKVIIGGDQQAHEWLGSDSEDSSDGDDDDDDDDEDDDDDDDDSDSSEMDTD